MGAAVGGWLFTALGGMPVSGINPYSLVVVVIGSAVVKQKSTKMLEMLQTLCEYHKLEAAREPLPDNCWPQAPSALHSNHFLQMMQIHRAWVTFILNS